MIIVAPGAPPGGQPRDEKDNTKRDAERCSRMFVPGCRTRGECEGGRWSILKAGGPAASGSGTRSTTPLEAAGEIDAGKTGGNMSEEQTLRHVLSDQRSTGAAVQADGPAAFSQRTQDAFS